MVRAQKERYRQALKGKRSIALEIIENIAALNPPGRFLEVDSAESSAASERIGASDGSSVDARLMNLRWVCVDTDKAVVKVLKRLREREKGGAPRWR